MEQIEAKTPVRRRVSSPCKRCGGEKENPAPRGARYCQSCRDALTPLWQVAERERGKRRAEKERRSLGVPGRPKVEVFEDGTRTCTSCGLRKRDEDFSPRSKSDPTKRHAHCKPCSSEGQHSARLARVFGITSQQYEMMLESQEGRCAICLRKPRRQRLAVDHNHKTGEIRGLLCTMCNHRVLGGAMENPTILRRAADYLDEPPARGMW